MFQLGVIGAPRRDDPRGRDITMLGGGVSNFIVARRSRYLCGAATGRDRLVTRSSAHFVTLILLMDRISRRTLGGQAPVKPIEQGSEGLILGSAKLCDFRGGGANHVRGAAARVCNRVCLALVM